MKLSDNHKRIIRNSGTLIFLTQFAALNILLSVYIPSLPEIDCLHDDSELSRDGNTITKGILCGEKTGNVPIFRLKGAKGRYIMANLAFVESAYRREVRGMGIEEFVVQ